MCITANLAERLPSWVIHVISGAVRTSASPPRAAKSRRHGIRRQSQTSRLGRDIIAHIAVGMIPLGTRQMAIGIGRRQLISALGGTAFAWPLAVHAQQQLDRVRRIGFLVTGLASDPLEKDNATAFLHGLDALGWSEGINLHIDWRWGGADAALMARQAAELVALTPDILLAGGNSAVDSVREQTRTIPIVFALVSDPVGMGYVQSLAHPGGNITGFSSYDPPIYTKQLQMLTEITPPATTVAVLYNPESAPYGPIMSIASLGAPSRAICRSSYRPSSS